MTFGDIWSGQTTTVQEGGEDAEWEISAEEQSNMQYIASRQELSDNKLKISVSDENKFRSHVLIGEAEANLSELLKLSQYEKEIAFAQELTMKGRISGTITLFLDLMKLGNHKDNRLQIPQYDTFEKAWTDDNTRKDFMAYVAKSHIDLFLSRESEVMIARLKA